MTEQELELVTREYLLDIYKAKYIGKIKVKKLIPFGYQISLGMNTPECPLVIYAELKDKEFLHFLKEELRNRRLDMVSYSKLSKTMPNECNTINKACSCNDKRKINRENK